MATHKNHFYFNVHGFRIEISVVEKRKIIVAKYTDGYNAVIREIATCHQDDAWDVPYGVRIAVKKVVQKIYARDIDKAERYLISLRARKIASIDNINRSLYLVKHPDVEIPQDFAVLDLEQDPASLIRDIQAFVEEKKAYVRV